MKCLNFLLRSVFLVLIIFLRFVIVVVEEKKIRSSPWNCEFILNLIFIFFYRKIRKGWVFLYEYFFIALSPCQIFVIYIPLLHNFYLMFFKSMHHSYLRTLKCDLFVYTLYMCVFSFNFFLMNFQQVSVTNVDRCNFLDQFIKLNEEIFFFYI